MKTAVRVWNIKETKLKFENLLFESLLFVHAVLGCDTTPSDFSLGKGSALQKYLKDKDFSECATVFTAGENNPVAGIVEYGEKAMIILFGRKAQDNLDSLRLGTGSIKCVKPKNLPPISSATRYHSLLPSKYKYGKGVLTNLQKTGVGQ